MNVQPANASTAALPATARPETPGAAVDAARNRAVQAAAKSDLPVDQSVQSTTAASGTDVENATRKVQTFVETMARDLQFSLDDESGVRVVKVVDRTTHEVIRQIPSEEIVAIAKALDNLQGLLFKEKA